MAAACCYITQYIIHVRLQVYRRNSINIFHGVHVRTSYSDRDIIRQLIINVQYYYRRRGGCSLDKKVPYSVASNARIGLKNLLELVQAKYYVQILNIIN